MSTMHGRPHVVAAYRLELHACHLRPSPNHGSCHTKNSQRTRKTKRRNEVRKESALVGCANHNQNAPSSSFEDGVRDGQSENFVYSTMQNRINETLYFSHLSLHHMRLEFKFVDRSSARQPPYLCDVAPFNLSTASISIDRTSHNR